MLQCHEKWETKKPYLPERGIAPRRFKEAQGEFSGEDPAWKPPPVCSPGAAPPGVRQLRGGFPRRVLPAMAPLHPTFMASPSFNCIEQRLRGGPSAEIPGGAAPGLHTGDFPTGSSPPWLLSILPSLVRLI